jgi:NAD(P)-dependent dehydrogenase (short-subunit alcohol dehydrogenase family)
MDNVAARVALVTGSSKGIGRAIASALLKEDIIVIICARNGAEIEATRAELIEQNNAKSDRVLAEVCDVRDYHQIVRLFKTIDEKFGGLDILVNNAGIGIFATVEEMSEEAWRAVIETNLNSLFYCCHEAIPRLRARQGGYIFNIGSLAGKNAFPRAAAYNASKFALIGFSEALMQEVRYENIRVSYIMPGSVKTDFGGARAGDEEWKLMPEDVAQVVIDLLHHNPRSLPSRVEIRPSQPRK